MAIVLLITTNNGQLIELPILGKFTLGRSSSCDLTLEDKEMSGKHGSFEINKQGQLLYTDLGSTNGSFINGNKVEKTLFQVGQELRVGNSTIIIDKKRLNHHEKNAIGESIKKIERNELPTSLPPKENSSKKSSEDNHTRTNSKSVSLDKDLKKKAPRSTWLGGNKQNVIEAEESSGETKFLKLDKSQNKSKK